MSRSALLCLLVPPSLALTSSDTVTVLSTSLLEPREGSTHNFFGAAVAHVTLLNSSTGCLAVGSPRASEGGCERGVIHLVRLGDVQEGRTMFDMSTMTADGTTIHGAAEDRDRFGASLAAIDIDGDGSSELAVGAPGASGGGEVSSSGTVMLLRLSSSATTVLQTTLICEGVDGFSGRSRAAPRRRPVRCGSGVASRPRR